MKYKLVKQVKDNDALRNSFIDLAIKTFDLSFKDWYKKATGPSHTFPTLSLIIIR